MLIPRDRVVYQLGIWPAKSLVTHGSWGTTQVQAEGREQSIVGLLLRGREGCI